VVLYGSETWSLTLRKEGRFRLFENRVLRTIFGPKSDEVPGEWKKIHNEDLHDLYCSPNIVRVITSRRIRWARFVARVGERGQVYTGFWLENLRGRNYLRDLGVDGKTIFS
jgi:hypothetical protein